MNIEPLLPADVAPLLAECDLLVSDISTAVPLRFFGHRADGTVIAVVGLELYPPFGLLRSLATAPAFRGRGFARELVAYAESFSAAQGIGSLFLLTTTAEAFFRKLGYSPAERSAAPATIQTTAQFSGLCPSSSAFLRKDLSVRRPPQNEGTDSHDNPSL